jgi:predicted nucleic acid-binding protein
MNLLLIEDMHHPAAIRVFERDPEARVLWTPWQRVEVFNGLYQLERTGTLQPGDARRTIRRLEMEVRLGYWPHVEFSWMDAVRRACQLAEKHGPKLRIRGMDLFQVAVALTVRAPAFLSFDSDQNALAKAAGLNLP